MIDLFERKKQIAGKAARLTFKNARSSLACCEDEKKVEPTAAFYFRSRTKYLFVCGTMVAMNLRHDLEQNGHSLPLVM